MARPTEGLPRWADVSGDIVTPNTGKKDVGYASAEKPPAQFVNWFWNLVYKWLLWISIGNWSRASLTDKTPTWSFSDYNERPRHYVDPAGYFGGSAIQEHYICRLSAATLTGDQDHTDILCPGINYSGDANCELDQIPASWSGAGWSTKVAHPCWRLRLLNASVSERAAIHSHETGSNRGIVGDLDNNVIVMEGRFAAETVGANEAAFFWGLHDFPQSTPTSYGDGSVNNFVMFEKLTGDTNWQLSVGDGAAGTSNDSGVPPVAGTFQMLRIELHGANTPVGVDNSNVPVARFFIDGVFVGQIGDANVPTGHNALGVGVRLQSTATGPAADLDADVGPIRVAHTQMLNWPSPQS